MPPRSAAGAALVEFYVVALFALIPLTMAIMEISILIAARNVVSYATFSAARTGAMMHADVGAMRRTLAAGLVPLHARTAEELDGGNVTGTVAAAFARSLLDATIFARLELLRPTAAAFEDFGEDEDGIFAIRNDALEFRDTRRGASSGLSVQEANVLEIRVTYCQRLIFPLIDRLALSLLRAIDFDAYHQLCYAAGRVPLYARSSVHMQSDPHPQR